MMFTHDRKSRANATDTGPLRGSASRVGNADTRGATPWAMARLAAGQLLKGLIAPAAPGLRQGSGFSVLIVEGLHGARWTSHFFVAIGIP